MHLEAVARSVTLPVLPWASADLVRLPEAPELLVTGGGDRLASSSELTELAERAGTSGELVYGWPAVVLLDRTRQVACAAMLLVDLVPAGDGAYTAAGRPRLNDGLLEALQTPREAADEARQLAAELTYGDVEAVVKGVEGICGALGLDHAPLAPPGRGAAPRPGARGAHNAAVAQIAPIRVASSALMEELRVLQTREDWASTAAARLAGPVLPQPPGVADRAPGATRPVTVAAALNSSQEQALRAAAHLPVTVVVGPPGTGKSELLAAVVADCAVAGESVLVASTNNHAVDVAVERAARTNTALLVRTGSREVRERLPEVLHGLTGRLETLPATLTLAQARYAQSENAVAAALAMVRQRGFVDAAMAATLNEHVQTARRLWRNGRVPSDVDGDRRTRAERANTRRWWRPSLTRRALRLLQTDAPTAGAEDVKAWLATDRSLRLARADLAALPVGGLDADAGRLEVALAARASAGAELAVRAAEVRATRHRAALGQLAGLRRDAGPRSRQTATERALPGVGWACTALAAASNFPLTPGLFDVLVIDEASQCHVAHVLPLAYRARRILVVGDPNQLAPVQTLSPTAIEVACRAGGLTPAQAQANKTSPHADSAFTAYEARADIQVLLHEHYRCHPAVAAWLNRAFYGDQLQVLTPPHRLRGPVRGLHWQSVSGRVEQDPAGGVSNHAEAVAVVAYLKGLLPELLSAGGAPEVVSVGIVTPFAAQARLIDRRLDDVLDADGRDALRLTVGTAHRLQGDERNLVLLSPVLSAGTPVHTARWVERERNLLNVATSRARAGLVVLGDDAQARCGQTPTLALLADAAQGRLPAPVVPEGALHSDAEKSLHTALTAAGIPIMAKPLVHGHELDLVVFDESGESGIDVEVDGDQHTDPAGRQRRRDIARDAVLRSAGWTVLRFPAWQAQHEPDSIVAAVAAVLLKRASTVGSDGQHISST